MTTGLSRRSFLTVSGGAAWSSGSPSRSTDQTQAVIGDGTPMADGSPMAMHGGGSGAAYMQIANAGTEDDTLGRRLQRGLPKSSRFTR